MKRDRSVPYHTVRLTRDNKDLKLVVTAGSRKEARWLFDEIRKDFKNEKSTAICIDSATKVKGGTRQAIVSV